MNKKTTHKEFIYQLERFLQVYFNPGDVVSTRLLRETLKENPRHPVHNAYRKFVEACNCGGGYMACSWRLTDFANRVASGMKYCEGFFTESKSGIYQSEYLKGIPYTRKFNYIKVPGKLRVPATTNVNNFLLLA